MNILSGCAIFSLKFRAPASPHKSQQDKRFEDSFTSKDVQWFTSYILNQDSWSNGEEAFFPLSLLESKVLWKYQRLQSVACLDNFFMWKPPKALRNNSSCMRRHHSNYREIPRHHRKENFTETTSKLFITVVFQIFWILDREKIGKRKRYGWRAPRTRRSGHEEEQ